MNIETVHQCNCCLGNKTLHPLVSAIDLSKANVMQRTIKFDFYTILLLECECEDFIYGRKYYDYLWGRKRSVKVGVWHIGVEAF